jgi:hypothetical protein
MKPPHSGTLIEEVNHLPSAAKSCSSPSPDAAQEIDKSAAGVATSSSCVEAAADELHPREGVSAEMRNSESPTEQKPALSEEEKASLVH